MFHNTLQMENYAMAIGGKATESFENVTLTCHWICDNAFEWCLNDTIVTRTIAATWLSLTYNQRKDKIS